VFRVKKRREFLERPNNYELLCGVGYLKRKYTSVPTKLKLGNELVGDDFVMIMPITAAV
jgi:hypothetical protein